MNQYIGLLVSGQTILYSVANTHQQKKWFAPCAFGRTGLSGRMEVETLDHDESPRVTSFRAITYWHPYFSTLTPNEVPSRRGAELANVVNSVLYSLTLWTQHYIPSRCELSTILFLYVVKSILHSATLWTQHLLRSDAISDALHAVYPFMRNLCNLTEVYILRY